MITIGDRCFRHCSSLEVLDIPSGVTTIGRAAIYGLNNVIICRPIDPPSLGSGNNNGSALIYVPDDSVNSYKAATNWNASQIANRIRPLSQYTG